MQLSFRWIVPSLLQDVLVSCPFRNALIEAKVYDDVLSEIYRQLEDHGLKLREMDAAIIDTSKANRAHLKDNQVRHGIM